MNSASSHRLPWILATALLAAGFALDIVLVEGGLRGPQAAFTGDTELYRTWAGSIVAGAMPYRDLAIEYPPFALPAFVVPALAVGLDPLLYRLAFGATMLACTFLAMVAVWAVRHDRYALLSVAVAPLLVGPLIAYRYDAWPAALTAVGVGLTARGRPRVGAVALAVGILAKVFPAVLVPLMAVYAGRRWGRREGLFVVLTVASVVALGLLPFVVIAPDGIAEMVRNLVARPLQIEALGATLIVVANAAAQEPTILVTGFGAHNIGGPLAEPVAAATTIAAAGLAVAIFLAFWRGTPSTERLLLALVAGLASFIGLGKVGSDQFVVWLIPLVAALHARPAVVARAALGVVLLATNALFPSIYLRLIEGDALAAAVIGARSIAILLIALVCLDALRRANPPPRTDVGARGRAAAGDADEPGSVGSPTPRRWSSRGRILLPPWPAVPLR